MKHIWDKRTAAAAVLLALAGMALPLMGSSTAISRADPYESFQSPSHNVYCAIGHLYDTAYAECEVVDHTWAAPPRPATDCTGVFGDRIILPAGVAPVWRCHSSTLKDDGAAVLGYGGMRSVDTISCESEAAGVRCTDSDTGHYFVLSRDNFELH